LFCIVSKWGFSCSRKKIKTSKQEEKQNKKNTISLMTSGVELIVWFFVFLFILLIVAACIPACRKWCQTQCYPCPPHKQVAALFRAQVGNIEQPEVPIPSAQPIMVAFSKPSNINSYTICRTNDYRISYNVQVGWTQPTVVSFAVNAVLPNGSSAWLNGSVQQTSVVTAPNAQNFTYTFTAALCKGTVLSLAVQAADDDSAVILGSAIPQVITPTTLASLCLEEV